MVVRHEVSKVKNGITYEPGDEIDPLDVEVGDVIRTDIPREDVIESYTGTVANISEARGTVYFGSLRQKALRFTMHESLDLQTHYYLGREESPFDGAKEGSWFRVRGDGVRADTKYTFYAPGWWVGESYPNGVKSLDMYSDYAARLAYESERSSDVFHVEDTCTEAD